MRDAWEEAHGSDADSLKSSDAKLAITTNGVTFHSPLMPYTNVYELVDESRKSHGKRIDFILFRGPPYCSDHPTLVPKEPRTRKTSSTRKFRATTSPSLITLL